MGLMLSVEDYRHRAQRKLPKLVFDFVDGAAESESTMRANQAAFADVTLRPRGGIDPGQIDLRTNLLGHELAMPLFVAPCGMARVVHPGGDRAGAAAAAANGTLFVLSAMSGHPVAEVVAAADGGPVWFQAYHVQDQPTTARAIARARDAGVAALVITIDSAVGSLRERDRRSGGVTILGSSKLAAAPHFVKLVRHPAWLADRLRDGLRPRFMNVLADDLTPAVLGQGLPARGLGWHDLPWIREIWEGPIVVKGVLTGGDARRALDEGAAALVVSNHGGRQLDTADATLRVLPEIVAAVGGRCPVIVDGGIRSGPDVLKALCLGATAVEIGRPWIYGLANGGQTGVSAVLQLFADSIARNLALLGASRPSELDRSFARVPNDWLEPDASQLEEPTGLAARTGR